MTGAWASYLTTLCEEAQVEPPGDRLSKTEASLRVDDFKERLGRD